MKDSDYRNLSLWILKVTLYLKQEIISKIRKYQILNFYLRSVLNKYIKKRIHSIKKKYVDNGKRRVYINYKFGIIVIDNKEDYYLER